jgi:hypothetical protein
MYETNFARMAPFLLACERRMISNIMKPHIDNVVRYYTDGFITKIKLDYKQSKANCGQESLDYVKLEKEIGNIKYEGYCPNVKIYHSNKVEGEFVVDK